MSNDYWKDMDQDPDAIARIKKSCELLDAKEGMFVLDIGCHKQEAAQYLNPNCKYLGIDTEKLHPNTYQVNIDGGFSFSEKAERILCLEVLEHLECPGGTLQTIHSLLKDDGIAVVSLPNEATLFHRLRALFGIVDQECFSFGGKHLHLPSLRQSRQFLEAQFEIVQEDYYESKHAIGCKQQWVKPLLKLIPLRILSRLIPSLFARGFIFKLKKLS